MLLCAAVLCLLLLSLNSSKAEGIPTTTDARIAAKKFQNALSQQVKKKKNKSGKLWSLLIRSRFTN